MKWPLLFGLVGLPMVGMMGCSSPEPVAVAPTATPVAAPTTPMMAAPTLAPPTPTPSPRPVKVVTGTSGSEASMTTTSTSSTPTFRAGQSLTSYKNDCLRALDGTTTAGEAASMSLDWSREKFALSDEVQRLQKAQEFDRANAMNTAVQMMDGLASAASYRSRFLEGSMDEREYNASRQSTGLSLGLIADRADNMLGTKTETERQNEATLGAMRRGMQ